MREKERSRDAHATTGLRLRHKGLTLFAVIVAVVTFHYLVRAQRMTETTNTLFRINAQQRYIAEEKNVNARLKCELAQLQRPDDVLKRLRDNGICLAQAPLERVIHVAMPATIVGLPEEPVPPAAIPPARQGLLLAGTGGGER
jgi:cell division protein FtsL